MPPTSFDIRFHCMAIQVPLDSLIFWLLIMIGIGFVVGRKWRK